MLILVLNETIDQLAMAVCVGIVMCGGERMVMCVGERMVM